MYKFVHPPRTKPSIVPEIIRIIRDLLYDFNNFTTTSLNLTKTTTPNLLRIPFVLDFTQRLPRDAKHARSF